MRFLGAILFSFICFISVYSQNDFETINMTITHSFQKNKNYYFSVFRENDTICCIGIIMPNNRNNIVNGFDKIIIITNEQFSEIIDSYKKINLKKIISLTNPNNFPIIFDGVFIKLAYISLNFFSYYEIISLSKKEEKQSHLSEFNKTCKLIIKYSKLQYKKIL